MKTKTSSGNQVQFGVLLYATLQDKDGHALSKGEALIRDEPLLHGIFYPKPEESLGVLQEKAGFLDTQKVRYRVLNFGLCPACNLHLHYEFNLESVQPSG
jgi:hypothetical protein